MDIDPPELPLQGGRVTAGVVRVGRTVRRPSGPHSDFVRRLLMHLERAGFEGAPRWLGTDGRGRDVLSYVEGDVPAELSWHGDEVLIAAARLIRRYHDATAPLLGASAPPPMEPEVVCHGDLSPCNFVFHGGLPVAIIDFDAATLGTRVLDLGYAAWLWLDLGNLDIAPAEQRRRLALFLTAYGAGGPGLGDVVGAILTRQRLLAAEGEGRGDCELVEWARACLHWTRRHLLRL